MSSISPFKNAMISHDRANALKVIATDNDPIESLHTPQYMTKSKISHRNYDKIESVGKLHGVGDWSQSGNEGINKIKYRK